MTEMWIERIARELGMTPRAVRRVNMYDEGDRTHYGQLLEGCQVKACFEQVRDAAALGLHQSCACTHCIAKGPSAADRANFMIDVVNCREFAAGLAAR